MAVERKPGWYGEDVNPGWERPRKDQGIAELRQVRNMWAKCIARAVVDGVVPLPRAVAAFEAFEGAIDAYIPGLDSDRLMDIAGE